MAGVKLEKPKTFNVKDIFLFWLKNLEREKPYLEVKRRGSLALTPKRTTEVWYVVKHEVEYLQKHVLNLDRRVIKLEQIDSTKTHFTQTTFEIFDLKKQIYEANARIDSLLKEDQESKKLLMTFMLFHKITVEFNRKAAERIIQGGVLNLGNRLGYLQIRKINRFTPTPDWGTSFKNKKALIEQGIQPKDKEHPDGALWMEWHDDPFYLRWSWIKRSTGTGFRFLANTRVYAFYPTKGFKRKDGTEVPGTKNMLAQANHANKFLHLRYEIIKERRKNTHNH